MESNIEWSHWTKSDALLRSRIKLFSQQSEKCQARRSVIKKKEDTTSTNSSSRLLTGLTDGQKPTLSLCKVKKMDIKTHHYKTL